MKLVRFLLLFLSISGFAQLGGEDEVYLGGDRIDATFKGGGMEKFGEFIDSEFDYSKVTKPGKMVGAFTIDEEGNVKNIKIIQFFDMESATEFIRVLKKCPKWVPAKRGGKAISVDIKYPMTFTIKEKKKDETVTEDTPTPNETVVTDPKKVPGGLRKFYEYVNKHYHMPNVPGLKGKVVVSFTINEDGTVSDCKILKDIGHGTGKELVRVLMSSPKWTPAMKEGKPVKTTFTLPLNIAVPEE